MTIQVLTNFNFTKKSTDLHLNTVLKQLKRRKSQTNFNFTTQNQQF